MIDVKVLYMLEKGVPQGQRSDFVNGALEDALVDFSRKKAWQGIEEFQKKGNFHITDEEIRKLRAYGRE